MVAWSATRAALGLPLYLNDGGHQIRDLVHVDDIAEATVRALVSPSARTGTLNVGTGIPNAIREVAALVGKHFPNVEITETSYRFHRTRLERVLTQTSKRSTI
ncbi:NAD-dependent epimerase/dehydratase family protein [Streptomyces sp. NPDC059096]|uniref:NAD-dependent epimerase/dehydratase family protein n=1 Tax=Streptomyces sp. NPDC059096 TaxID=3346727 RepID=UPI0036CCC026